MAEEKFDATKYKNDFQKEIIDSYAKTQGYKSLNAFVVDAINEKMN